MGTLNYQQLADLFVQAKSGDEAAFEKIYGATYPAQFFSAFRVLKNHALAEEAVQNMYIGLYQGMDQVKEPMALVQFMNQSTYFCSMKLLRKEKPDSKEDLDDHLLTMADPKPTPAEAANQKDDISLVNTSLSELEPVLSSVLVKRYMQNMPISTIAQEMGVSNRTVLRYLKKGVVEMRKIIEKLRNASLSLFIFAEPVVARFLRTATKQASQQTATSYQVFAAKVGATSTATGAAAAGLLTMAPPLLAGKVALGVVSAVAVVGLAGGLALPPRYTMNTSVFEPYTSDPIILSVESTGPSSIRTIQVFDANQQLVSQDFGNSESLTFSQNGNYTLVITTTLGLSATEHIEVTNLDNTAPTALSLTEGEELSLQVTDAQSGIDWSKVTAQDAEGNAIPYTVEEDRMVFPLETDYAQVVLVDYCGNADYVTITR